MLESTSKTMGKVEASVGWTLGWAKITVSCPISGTLACRQNLGRARITRHRCICIIQGTFLPTWPVEASATKPACSTMYEHIRMPACATQRGRRCAGQVLDVSQPSLYAEAALEFGARRALQWPLAGRLQSGELALASRFSRLTKKRWGWSRRRGGDWPVPVHLGHSDLPGRQVRQQYVNSPVPALRYFLVLYNLCGVVARTCCSECLVQPSAYCAGGLVLRYATKTGKDVDGFPARRIKSWCRHYLGWMVQPPGWQRRARSRYSSAAVRVRAGAASKHSHWAWESKADG